MKIKAWQIVIVGGILIVGGWGWNKMRVKSSKQDVFKIVSPYQGNMEIIISATGRVLPKNRLQVKPPVNGRIEQVLVVEGQKIKAGGNIGLDEFNGPCRSFGCGAWTRRSGA
jgi:macrolide-specific efflux system membrane fusion protein